MKVKNLFLKVCAVALTALVCALAVPAVTAKAASAPASGSSVLKVDGARAAMLLDYDTGTVIYEQNSTERQPIASMVKIMTLLLAFEQADSGLLDYEEEVSVSQTASSMGGSQAFLDAGSSYKVNDLLQSIVVASANDSCVAIAEKIDGSVDAFVSRMNKRAAELGMENTCFVNCTGLPSSGQYSCAKDVAAMSRELFSHKKFFEYSGIWMYDFAHPGGRTTRLTNTNKLIKAYEGCDGGKTGFTNEAMSCLSATAKRGNTRLMSIVIGATDSKTRNAQICKLFNYGFAGYETKEVIKGGEKLSEPICVKGGKEKTVEAAYQSSVYMFGKKGSTSDYEITYEIPSATAPVAENDILGKAVVSVDGKSVGEASVVAVSKSDKMGYIDIVDEFIAEW